VAIVKIVCVDPDPPNGDDLIVYQVPAGSRAHGLLVEMFEKLSIEHAVFVYEKPRKIKWHDIPPQA
jgi:hypothetical protein